MYIADIEGFRRLGPIIKYTFIPQVLTHSTCPWSETLFTIHETKISLSIPDSVQTTTLWHDV